MFGPADDMSLDVLNLLKLFLNISASDKAYLSKVSWQHPSLGSRTSGEIPEIDDGILKLKKGIDAGIY